MVKRVVVVVVVVVEKIMRIGRRQGNWRMIMLNGIVDTMVNDEGKCLSYLVTEVMVSVVGKGYGRRERGGSSFRLIVYNAACAR